MNHSILCILFDSNYLDNGIALYNSMLRVMDSFKLYTFTFDEKSEMILRKNSLKDMFGSISKNLYVHILMLI